MDLHRAGRKPDWATIAPRTRNLWQRLAVRTRGLATPGNVVSLGGLAIVFIGLWLVLVQNYWLAVVALLVGRFADLLDGYLAQASGTKSPLGEKVDASFDKLGTFATLIVLGATGLMPWWQAIGLCLPHIIISGLALWALRRHTPLHPSPLGKLSMGVAWICLPMFILAATGTNETAPTLSSLASLLALTSTAMGLAAALRYWRAIISA